MIPATFISSQGILDNVYYYEISPTKIVRVSSTTFTYHSTQELPAGQLVTMPIGKTTYTGVVIRATAKPSYKTRPVATILDIPPLPKPLIETALWMSHYYATHLATVFQTVLPRGVTKKRRALASRSIRVDRGRTHFLLNKHQTSVVEQLCATKGGSVIVHGVTGSGKTAVYIEYAKHVINSGKSVIVLVPEIALTSQLVADFQYHFDEVLLTHSRQTESERHQTWLAALCSSAPVVAIGPRSALFLPLVSVGAIIIDEAHEPSFKQDQSPRYSGLRVASVLAHAHGGIAVQGSATPLVSEFFIAKETGRPILSLPIRAKANAVTPSVTVVDMTKKGHFSRHRFFSNILLNAIEAQLEAGQQVLIFHNRRGSASTTLCESCGWSATCPRCFVPLTLHADIHRLQCHICDHQARVATACPECNSTDVVHKGIGTKLITSELAKLFPSARIARFDSDSTSEGAVEKRYQELYDGTIDIIVGTQVIAKGLDLPHLRLVGVVQADAGLMLPDYMASERTFQLLAQVVGRVGRSQHNTSVIIQSYRPNASAIKFGANQDFSGFYNETILERRRGKLPPFTYLLKLTCVYKTEATAVRNARVFASQLRGKYPDVTILGPAPSFYERQKDTYRWQLIIRSTNRNLLINIVKEDVPSAHWQFDIDPMSLL